MSKLRPLPPKKVIKALSKVGFVPVRQKGSHIILKNEEGMVIVVPNHPGEDIIKTGRTYKRRISEVIGGVIMINDTDHDGIDDGAEFEYWQNYLYKLWPYREPRKEDVSLGDYIDSDDDNIPDIVESLLSNNSTFVKFADWALNNDLEAWNDYSWCIAYFYSIALGEEFSTVYDDIKNNKINAIRDYESRIKAVAHNDKYKAQIENATQWLRDEFNPLITESMAPVITEFVVNTVWEGLNARAQIVLEVRDVAGISRIRIRSVCPDVFGFMIWTVYLDYNGERTVVIGEDEPFYIDVTEYSAVLTYNISVNATDTLGNSAEWYKVDGPFGAFIKTVADMLRAFWEFLCEVGKVLAKAFEILIEWIKGLIENLLKPVIDSIKSGVKNWVDSLLLLIDEILSAYGVRGDYEQSSMRNIIVTFMRTLFGTTFLILMGLFTGLAVLITALGPIIGLIVSSITALITSIILIAFIGTENIQFTPLSLDMFSDLSLNNIVDFTRNYLEQQDYTDETDTRLWEVLAVAFGMMGIALTGWLYHIIKAPFLVYVSLGFSIAITISAIVIEGYILNHANSYIERKYAMRTLTFIETVCMFLGLIIDFNMIDKIPSKPQLFTLLLLGLIFKYIAYALCVTILLLT